jgi:FkbM family methyltransferase
MINISVIKYYVIRIIEKIPFIQIFIYNYISNFPFLFPHEKDYFGIKKLIDLNDTNDFIDVGGNIGLSVIGFRKLGYKNRIIIFEPDKNYCVKKLLKLKTKIAKLKLIQYGLSNKNEDKIFYQAYFLGIKMHFLSSFDKKYLNSILRQVYSLFNIFFTIKTTKLSLKKFDTLKLKNRPSFIKIDVEGYDHKVIEGMLKTIYKYKPVILVEQNKENFYKINKLLRKKYTPYKYIFEKDLFKKVTNKEIFYINSTFKRNLKLSLPRNIFFIPIKN